MSGTIKASAILDGASATTNLALDSSGNVTVGNNLTVSGTGNSSFGGNVGIGITSPTGYGNVNLQLNGINPLIRFTTPTSGTAVANGTQIGQSGLDFSIVNFQAGTLQFWTSTTERMRIDSSGNVGIGTASPVVKLSLGNNVGTQGIASQISVYDDGTANNRIGFGVSSGLFNMVAGGGTDIAFYTNGNGSSYERMRIGTNGVLVNTTSALTTQSSTKLSVLGSVAIQNNSGGTLNSTTGYKYYLAGADTSHWIGSTGSSGNSMYFGEYATWYFYNTNTSANVASIDNTGTYTKLSDQSVKTNIQNLTYGLDSINKLRPISYTYTGGKTINEQGYEDSLRENCIGFIAQEVQPIIPNVVLEMDKEKKLLAVDYTSMIPILVKALQEAVAKIDALETRIAKLEAK
jgi:Chaperone of endosialidase